MNVIGRTLKHSNRIGCVENSDRDRERLEYKSEYDRLSNKKSIHTELYLLTDVSSDQNHYTPTQISIWKSFTPTNTILPANSTRNLHLMANRLLEICHFSLQSSEGTGGTRAKRIILKQIFTCEICFIVQRLSQKLDGNRTGGCAEVRQHL